METVKKTSLYPLGIRIWHWVNAIIFIVLIVTGIQLRAPNFSIFSEYAMATSLHFHAGMLLGLSFLFWLFYCIFKRTIRHYLPHRGDIRKVPEQVIFYTFFIFRGRPNPFTATEENKFNVLQKMSYGAVMFILVPVIIITGVLFDNILSFSQVINAMGGLRILDVVHVIAGYMLGLFLIIHMYMATLGKTVTTYLKSIIMGE